MKKENQLKIRPIFSISHANHQNSAFHLFERAPDQGYIAEWTQALMQPPPDECDKRLFSVLVFRLNQEWLALPTICFKEITSRKPMHRIPHRTSKFLLGIVNLNGELKLYVALDQLLEIEPFTAPLPKRAPYQEDRMVAIAQNGDLWVFPVDEIDGIYNINLCLMENVPVNISKSTAGYLKGIVKIGNKSVGLLDEELLFANLKRSI
jgi:chemotaxis-related protein WspD